MPHNDIDLDFPVWESERPEVPAADPRPVLIPLPRPRQKKRAAASSAPEAVPTVAGLLKQAIRLATARSAKEARHTAAVEAVLVEVLAELLGGAQ